MALAGISWPSRRKVDRGSNAQSCLDGSKVPPGGRQGLRPATHRNPQDHREQQHDRDTHFAPIRWLHERMIPFVAAAALSHGTFVESAAARAKLRRKR